MRLAIRIAYALVASFILYKVGVHHSNSYLRVVEFSLIGGLIVVLLLTRKPRRPVQAPPTDGNASR